MVNNEVFTGSYAVAPLRPYGALSFSSILMHHASPFGSFHMLFVSFVCFLLLGFSDFIFVCKTFTLIVSFFLCFFKIFHAFICMFACLFVCVRVSAFACSFVCLIFFFFGGGGWRWGSQKGCFFFFSVFFLACVPAVVTLLSKSGPVCGGA